MSFQHRRLCCILLFYHLPLLLANEVAISNYCSLLGITIRRGLLLWRRIKSVIVSAPVSQSVFFFFVSAQNFGFGSICAVKGTNSVVGVLTKTRIFLQKNKKKPDSFFIFLKYWLYVYYLISAGAAHRPHNVSHKHAANTLI